MSETRCEKCGGLDVYVRWHGAGAYHESRVGFSSPCYGDYGRNKGKPKGEHLHYTCRTCGYGWTGPLTPARAAGEGDTRP